MLPIVDVTLTNGKGIPVTEAANGLGMPVAVAANGLGVPVVYVAERGTPVVTIATSFASGTLSFNGNVVLNDQIVIGGVTYSFVNSLVAAYDVLIGATASISILNLIAAVTAGAGEGTGYGTGTVEHPDVTASSSPGVMNVTAKVAGSAGNSIATTSTSLTATWGAATLQGGA